MGISTAARQFAQFLESVRAKASTPGLDLAVVRDSVDTHVSASTEPEGVTYADVDADGVPALWAIPEGADPDRALLHFHFGGSVAASIPSDRKAAGHIAKAAGARSLVVGFRLAPEHPHPAQVDDAETAYRWLLAQGCELWNIGSTGHSI
ncbi:alpha/beta hydrolase fold domain-containing protein [Streptomyces sp. NPDC048564]|uniref:alpha/beta hydrolase fold domain-containing protein n=1 Tax=Streptomyces sp. NPDC048564 TaxID=3155760 RepID=UPI003421F848